MKAIQLHLSQQHSLVFKDANNNILTEIDMKTARLPADLLSTQLHGYNILDQVLMLVNLLLQYWKWQHCIFVGESVKQYNSGVGSGHEFALIRWIFIFLHFFFLKKKNYCCTLDSPSLTKAGWITLPFCNVTMSEGSQKSDVFVYLEFIQWRVTAPPASPW